MGNIWVQAVAEHQPANKNRMTSELSTFAARLRGSIHSALPAEHFGGLALELFALQFAANAPYRKICEARRVTPLTVHHWTEIPAVPTAAFKELELSCLPAAERTTVFHSSGTTEQRPSRHFHNAESLAVYEASLWPWFTENLRFTIGDLRLLCLTPPPAQAPRSSLVHMFEVIRRKLGADESAFVGRVDAAGAWSVDVTLAQAALRGNRRREEADPGAPGNPPPHGGGYDVPLLLLGTAFSFVHLLDYFGEQNLRFQLPPGSRVLETGGYKGRSRTLPKAELHALITERLGVPASHIVCEYGMSELSSQAYDQAAELEGWNLPHPGPLPTERENRRPPAGVASEVGNLNARNSLFPLPGGEGQGEGKRHDQTASLVVPAATARVFHFPPWVRGQIISPETGGEVADGETGLLRVFDLANVYSVMAIQTEDLAVRRGDGFELIGRAALSEPRGCSLTAV